MKRRGLLAIAVAVAVMACGGGGGRPTRPTVTIVPGQVATTVTVSAAVSTTSPPPTAGTPTAGTPTAGTPTTRTPTTGTPTTGTPTAGTPTTAVPTLSSALDAVLFNTNSCLVVTDDGGRVLYEHNGDVSLVPASAQKLIVAAVALDRLGPDYRFTTRVLATAPPAAGVVDDLWLVGGGDPLLASPEYAAYVSTNPVTVGYPVTPIDPLVDELVATGVQVVRNGVHGDGSRYDDVPYLATWPPMLNQGEFDIGPLGGLEVDQGLDRFHPDIPTADPSGHGAGVLARLLGARGVAATQGVDEPAPARAVVLASVRSAPLSQVVEAMLRASDNQIAELLVREIDREAGGAGTTAGGMRVVTADASRLGLPAAGLALTDGSGLSRTNRVTCATLLAALDLGDQPRFSAIAQGLPVAGVSGTFRDIFTDTPLAGHLAAKGGYIPGVASLVGHVDLVHRRRFALEVNGAFSFTVGLGLVERVAETVGTR